MSFRLWFFGLGCLVSMAVPAMAAGLADSIETTQFSDAVVVYVRDLDVWRMRYPDLCAELQLLGGAKGEIRHDVDEDSLIRRRYGRVFDGIIRSIEIK